MGVAISASKELILLEIASPFAPNVIANEVKQSKGERLAMTTSFHLG